MRRHFFSKEKTMTEYHADNERLAREMTPLHARFGRIERAYTAALNGRDPNLVNIFDLLPAIFAAVPDTSPKEIVEALCWSARKDFREADRLEGKA
jgi:hypothetical protein